MKKTIEVVAALINENNKYFCCQRKNYGELAKKWEFPGGKIELNETQQAALKRELKEELSIDVNVKDRFITVVHEYDTFILKMYTYFTEISNGKIALNEHINSKWLIPEKMLNMDFAEADKPIIKKLIESNKL